MSSDYAGIALRLAARPLESISTGLPLSGHGQAHLMRYNAKEKEMNYPHKCKMECIYQDEGFGNYILTLNDLDKLVDRFIFEDLH